MNLRNKNIILVAPSFFNYEIEIKNKLEEFGANVHYIDDRFNNGTFIKILLRIGIGGEIFKNRIFKYFLKTLPGNLLGKIDYVFIINPEVVNKEVLNKYKKTMPNAIFILYMWDSFKNKKQTLNILNDFDYKFSFDKKDCLEYNMDYLPLFYIDKYKDIAEKKDYKYDFTFIGTAHSDRYFLVKKIKNQFLNYRFFEFYYFQSIILFIYNKLVNKHFKNIKYKDITYVSLRLNDVLNVVSKSKIVIDIQHPFQDGFTMRLIEMIGAKRKIITTNKNVEFMDFYNENNILIIDRNLPIIPKSFLKSDYIDLPSDIYEKYSIGSWLKTIFK
jgi:hypothetical protein